MALDLRAALETLSGAEGVGGLSAAPDAAEALLRPAGFAVLGADDIF